MNAFKVRLISIYRDYRCLTKYPRHRRTKNWMNRSNESEWSIHTSKSSWSEVEESDIVRLNRYGLVVMELTLLVSAVVKKWISSLLNDASKYFFARKKSPLRCLFSVLGLRQKYLHLLEKNQRISFLHFISARATRLCTGVRSDSDCFVFTTLYSDKEILHRCGVGTFSFSMILRGLMEGLDSSRSMKSFSIWRKRFLWCKPSFCVIWLNFFCINERRNLFTLQGKNAEWGKKKPWWWSFD